MKTTVTVKHSAYKSIVLICFGFVFISLHGKANAQFYDFVGSMSPYSWNNVTQYLNVDRVVAKEDTADEDQPQPVASAAALRFTPNIATRKRNLAGFVAKTRAQSPENAAQMEQLFSSTDIFAAMEQGLAPMGLRIDNVADAYVVYWVTAWEASRGISGTDTSRTQAQAVKAQVSNALLSTPQFTKATPAQKQELAEALLIQSALISASMKGTAGDDNQRAGIAKAVRQGAKAMGLDLDAVNLGEAGFVPAG